MRRIANRHEPTSLTEHRSTSYSDFDNYGAKEELRIAIATEQRGLCCYCMCRIHPKRTSMKIEHWRCQARHPDEQLDYRNLLGACLGGEGHGQPPSLQHCDTRKGNRDLKWNPSVPEHRIETRIRYELDGSIHADGDDGDFDDQLNNVLNLNLPVLKSHRKAVYDAVLQWWVRQKRLSRGRVTRERLQRERARYDARVGELTPYVQVAVWLLGQRIGGTAV